MICPRHLLQFHLVTVLLSDHLQAEVATPALKAYLSTAGNSTSLRLEESSSYRMIGGSGSTNYGTKSRTTWKSSR
jgi:hypothetical protein